MKVRNKVFRYKKQISVKNYWDSQQCIEFTMIAKTKKELSYGTAIEFAQKISGFGTAAIVRYGHDIKLIKERN